MQYTTVQKIICENIVTIHETGRVSSNSYGTVVNVRGDLGGLTYGKHQVTINSGNLNLMLARYMAAPGAKFASVLAPFMPAIKAKNITAASIAKLRPILQAAGDDPIMVAVQDKYFDDQYWNPAVRFCDAKRLDKALALAVVYDSMIHGSLHRIDKKLPAGLQTREWVTAYIETRRQWFLTHSNALLRRCTYRMDTFKVLYDANNFDLNSPVMAHGRRADVNLPSVPNAPGVTIFNEDPSFDMLSVSAGSTQRVLDMGDRGPDVAALQTSLRNVGYLLNVDGDFGNNTYNAVRQFQSLYGLLADGIAGPSTLRVLDQVDDK